MFRAYVSHEHRNCIIERAADLAEAKAKFRAMFPACAAAPDEEIGVSILTTVAEVVTITPLTEAVICCDRLLVTPFCPICGKPRPVLAVPEVAVEPVVEPVVDPVTEPVVEPLPVEIPVVEEPPADAPAVDELPPADVIDASEPAPVEEPVTVEPVVDEFSEDLPLEEPTVEEPVVEEPTVEEPVVEEPVVEEPIDEDAPTEELPVEEPVTEEPVTEEPVVEDAAAEEPVAEPAPATTDPTLEQLEIAPRHAAALGRAGITTRSQLQAYIDANGSLEPLRGISPSVAESIQQIVEESYQTYPA